MTVTGMAKGGGKKSRAKSSANQEIFVCDYCLAFEGSYQLVAQHEKTCKPYFERLCKLAGTFSSNGTQAERKRRNPDQDEEENSTSTGEKGEKTYGRTAKEKREAAKKRKKQALGLETANERLEDVERAHLERAGEERAEKDPPEVSTRDASANNDAPSRGGPPSKAERRKAEKKRRKEAARAEAARAEAASGAVDDAPRAKVAKAAHVVAAAREAVLRKGVRIIELAAGGGAVVEDRKRVKVRYVGRLGSPSGAVFDQGTLSFRLGKGEVIQGWDIGVQGMRVGSQRRITVPPAAGYGKTADPGGKIPPNSTLCFDVEVV